MASIPPAATSSPFVAWSANSFAVLDLGSLYSIPAGMLRRFVSLQTVLSGVLVFFGCGGRPGPGPSLEDARAAVARG